LKDKFINSKLRMQYYFMMATRTEFGYLVTGSSVVVVFASPG